MESLSGKTRLISPIYKLHNKTDACKECKVTIIAFCLNKKILMYNKTILLLLDSAPMKAIKSSIGGKEVYLKQGILAEISKKESLKEEHLVAMKQFKPKEDEISGISYHEPPQFPGFKAKPQKQPDVYKRIVSDGKEKWINNEGETKENEK